MRKIFILLIVIFISIYSIKAQNMVTSSFNENWLNSIVSIEKKIGSKYFPIGTGFLFTTKSNHVVIVTAKHVVLNKKEPVGKIGFRINLKNGKSKIISENKYPEYMGTRWIYSSPSDIACHFFAWDSSADLSIIPYDKILESKNLNIGASVFIPGFPMGLRSPEHYDPIVRSGTVALIKNNQIIVDAFVFPGNSGSPVLYVPLIKVDNVTLHSSFLNEERLIGLVSSYIPYNDVAYSKQTNRPRVVFEENSGLCEVIPVEEIINLLNSSELLKEEKKIKSTSNK